MKTHCEDCGITLPADGVGYVCAYECSFCPACTANMHNVCSHCGGELVRRPRRMSPLRDETKTKTDVSAGFRLWKVWALSFGAWSFVSLAYTVTIAQLYRSMGSSVNFLDILGLQCSQTLTYAPLTPFVFALANRYPMQRLRWGKRLLLLLAGGLIFTLVQVALRGLTPYAFWDPHVRHWVPAVDYHIHGFRIHWYMYKALFLTNLVDDVIATYLPIVLIAHVMSYYQAYRARELRSSQLQAQLEKARLQALKSQLQPHFLFNTLNSISALMLTDVKAADRMITRLGDLLRTSLESAGTQMTTLRRELEFVSCYIEIEKVRFEERLNVTLDIAPETLDASVPHLLLQPLVDNAIKHGISKLLAGGKIRISAAREGTDLLLEVKDNGPGICALRDSLSDGLGLSVTRERLETIYGQNQSVQLLALQEGGVVARVSIPLRMATSDNFQETSVAH
jgi:two-component system LytT family sensor kinase